MKRKQYDNAIPYLEKTVESSTLYNNNEEISAKASKYLPQLYVREGNREWKNKSFDASLAYFDKALALNENLYQAYQGKGLVYLDMDETDMMLESFAKAKAGAEAKGDTKTIDKVNGVIDSYYNKFITEEMEMVDPEENDYTYVTEACENALGANPNNPRALYHLALVSNKNSQYESAISYAQKAVQNEKDPVWASAANYELGLAYDKSSNYEKACEAYRLVTEDPFLSKAEKKMVDICD
jgi:tetratricopeptide (TPR) repeat protein